MNNKRRSQRLNQSASGSADSPAPSVATRTPAPPKKPDVVHLSDSEEDVADVETTPRVAHPVLAMSAEQKTMLEEAFAIALKRMERDREEAEDEEKKKKKKQEKKRAHEERKAEEDRRKKEEVEREEVAELLSDDGHDDQENKKMEEEEEGQRLEKAKEDAIREEREANQEVQVTIDQMQQTRTELHWKTVKEEKQTEAVQRLREQLRRQEERLQKTKETKVELEASFAQLKSQFLQAKAKFAAKTTERVKASRDLDNHPYSQSLRYSRECPVCIVPNPAERAVMTTCGHTACLACAEQIQKTDFGNILCPSCGTATKYVRVFEHLATTDVRQQTPEVRKRRNTDEITTTPKRGRN